MEGRSGEKVLGFKVEIGRKQGLPGDKVCYLLSPPPKHGRAGILLSWGNPRQMVGLIAYLCFLMRSCTFSWWTSEDCSSWRNLGWYHLWLFWSSIKPKALSRVSQGRAFSRISPWVFVLLKREDYILPCILPPPVWSLRDIKLWWPMY